MGQGAHWPSTRTNPAGQPQKRTSADDRGGERELFHHALIVEPDSDRVAAQRFARETNGVHCALHVLYLGTGRRHGNAVARAIDPIGGLSVPLHDRSERRAADGQNQWL
eukprot:7380864-Prymnesium_polylepis.1